LLAKLQKQQLTAVPAEAIESGVGGRGKFQGFDENQKKSFVREREV